ncbi:hypothetical protein like AT5G46940 [Hibiscus trionum]|uniref:Pectinesterase inhibitor domain-containing protein n=1 Tax=Hibiscus trionum TaxID=183268 RepID=A0A9W7LSI9_HIBTR|nr:hypothetical protein like AT5G46940 [Hibiscus trionum]
MMKLRSFSSFGIPLFLSFFLLISTSTSRCLSPGPDDISFIRKTCKKCAQSDPNLSYNFCVTSLQAAPNSHLANDLRQLGKISIKLLGRNLTNSRSYIKEFLKKKMMDPFVRSCLRDCLQLYSDASLTAKQAIQDYKAKRYDDSNIDVSSIMDASTTCEDGFKEKEGVVSPLTKRNNDTFLLSAISLSIINMIRLNDD